MNSMTTDSLYFQIQQLNTVLDLVEKLQSDLLIPCEVSDEDLLALSAIAVQVGDYKEQVEARLFHLNKQLNERLEAQINAAS